MSEQSLLLPDVGTSVRLKEKGGDDYIVHSWTIDTWQQSEAYGRLNVRAELQKMQAWLDSNPRQRKTNTKKFVIAWLNRATELKGQEQQSSTTAYRTRVQQAHRAEMAKPEAAPEVARAALQEAMRMLRA